MISLNKDEVLSRRRRLNQEQGDAFLASPEAQRELLFTWTGTTLRDEVLDVPLEYFYPSTIGTSLFYHGSFERGEIAFVERVLAQLESPVIFDIGANIGLHTVHWGAASPSARLYAFEPVPSNIELLRRNVGARGLSERVTIEPYAVDAVKGRAVMYETVDAAYSTLKADSTMPFVAAQEVRTVTLDGYAALRQIEHIDFIKIDVEGWEDKVLEGAAATIERDCPFVFVELSAKHAGAPREPLIDRFIALGYVPYVISDGVVTPYRKHNDYAQNYFFVSPRHSIEIPETDSEIARDEIAQRIEQLESQWGKISGYREELQEKDDEIMRLKVAAEERLQLINRAQDVFEHGDEVRMHEVEQQYLEVKIQSNAAAERLVVIENLSERVRFIEDENANLRQRNESLQQQLEIQAAAANERLAALEETAAAVSGQETIIQELGRLADERLEVIRTLHEQQKIT